MCTKGAQRAALGGGGDAQTKWLLRGRRARRGHGLRCSVLGTRRGADPSPSPPRRRENSPGRAAAPAPGSPRRQPARSFCSGSGAPGPVERPGSPSRRTGGPAGAPPSSGDTGTIGHLAMSLGVQSLRDGGASKRCRN